MVIRTKRSTTRSLWLMNVLGLIRTRSRAHGNMSRPSWIHTTDRGTFSTSPSTRRVGVSSPLVIRAAFSVPQYLLFDISSSNKTVKRLTERHFPRRVPPTEKKCKPSKHSKRRETVLLSRLWCCSVRRWVFWGLRYKEKLLRQCKLHAYYLQYIEQYHTKFHSHRAKNTEDMR